MAVRSKITIFNAALLRTGNQTVSEGDGAFLNDVLEANYDEIVRQAFEGGEGRFSFGRARTTLTGRSDGRFGFDDAYAMPVEVIHVDEVFFNEHAAQDIEERWEIDGVTNELLCDASNRTVEIEYLKVGLEHTWSASFALAVQRKLEAVIKDALEETEEASAKEQEADLALLKAGVKASDNRSKRRASKKMGRLLKARRGYYRDRG